MLMLLPLPLLCLCVRKKLKRLLSLCDRTRQLGESKGIGLCFNIKRTQRRQPQAEQGPTRGAMVCRQDKVPAHQGLVPFLDAGQ